jgi:hypothetical protein
MKQASNFRFALFLGLLFSLARLPASAQPLMFPTSAPHYPFQFAAYTGRMLCEDRVTVTISENTKQLHHYEIAIGKLKYKAVRVPTDSGAIRLENKSHHVVWLQMANKSMLLNEKAGKRLANNCRNDLQVASQRDLSQSTAPTVLDGLQTR